MKEKTDFIAILEEYKGLFTDFFCDPKPRSVKVERSFDIVEELSEELIKNIGIFTIDKNEFQSKFKESVKFAINNMNLWDISKMKKDEKKIKIYSEDFLVGIFYLPKQIQVEFLITWTNQPYFRVVSIHGIWLNSRLEKEKKDYELKVLPKREGSLRVRIRIRTKDYKKNIERILFYGKIYSYLEIVFEEEIGSVPLCINGLYLFEVSRIELDEEKMKLFLRRKDEQSQKEYSIRIYYEEKRIEIYKKYGIIYLVCPLGDDNDIDMKFLSTKENLRLGHSIYR
ncbi:MAG: hypothetical protein HFI05_16540 [Lachnospiraceae bacterium]|jgi:hypothetical protein|nr:hypothetical protein [Lachnospiraceae bacterium]